MEKKKGIGPVAFAPLLTFLIVYLGAGIGFSIIGVKDSTPFKQISREFAVLCGLLTVVLMSVSGGKKKIDTNIDLVAKHCGEPGVMLMLMIFALAGAFSGVAKEMGGMDAAVNCGLSLIPPQFALAGIFIVSALLATAMGTSMGTISAVGPIALAMAEQAGLAQGAAIAAVLGGAMFGDNLSVISDTTIAATRGAGCEMRDKFKMNFLIALPAAIITIVFYAIAGKGGQVVGDYSYSFIKVIPYLVVFITAICGLNVILVLMLGIISCGIIGFGIGTLTLQTFSSSITDGIAGMFSIIIVTLILRGLTGIAMEYGGVDWLVSKMGKRIHSRRSAEYGMSLLAGVIDVSMGNNTMGILISAPLAMKFARIYNIAPKRVASLLDISACVFQSFIPHGGQLMLCMTLTGLSPFTIIKSSYYPMLLAIATIITIQFGLMKTKEERQGINIYKGISEDGPEPVEK